MFVCCCQNRKWFLNLDSHLRGDSERWLPLAIVEERDSVGLEVDWFRLVALQVHSTDGNHAILITVHRSSDAHRNRIIVRNATNKEVIFLNRTAQQRHAAHLFGVFFCVLCNSSARFTSRMEISFYEPSKHEIKHIFFRLHSCQSNAIEWRLNGKTAQLPRRCANAKTMVIVRYNLIDGARRVHQIIKHRRKTMQSCSLWKCVTFH